MAYLAAFARSPDLRRGAGREMLACSTDLAPLVGKRDRRRLDRVQAVARDMRAHRRVELHARRQRYSTLAVEGTLEAAQQRSPELRAREYRVLEG